MAEIYSADYDKNGSFSTSQPIEGQTPPGSILFSVSVGVHALKTKTKTKNKKRKEMNKGPATF